MRRARATANNPEPRNTLDNDRSHDATLLIRSIINQILNLYKNASEIPTTKAVQSVP
jgi:hypothetical protein